MLWDRTLKDVLNAVEIGVAVILARLGCCVLEERSRHEHYFRRAPGPSAPPVIDFRGHPLRCHLGQAAGGPGRAAAAPGAGWSPSFACSGAGWRSSGCYQARAARCTSYARRPCLETNGTGTTICKTQ